MSTRGSLFFHEDESSGVTVHIYEEATDRTIHIEVEHEFGVTNVVWPIRDFIREVMDDSEKVRLWRAIARHILPDIRGK